MSRFSTALSPKMPAGTIVSVLTIVLLLLSLGGCDSHEVGVPDDGKLVAAAQAWYAAALKSPSPTPNNNTHNTGRLVRRYAPDWSTAQVMTRPRGSQAIVELLGSGVARTHGDRLAIMRTIVFSLRSDGTVASGKILAFLSPDPIHRSSLARYVRSYWDGVFLGRYVTVAEYSVYYQPQRVRLFRTGGSVHEVTLAIREREAVNKESSPNRAVNWFLLVWGNSRSPPRCGRRPEVDWSSAAGFVVFLHCEVALCRCALLMRTAIVASLLSNHFQQ